MKILQIPINCGKSTCAKSPGNFCQFFGTIKFGTIPACRLFPTNENSYTKLEEKDGWTQRCNECLLNQINQNIEEPNSPPST